MCLDINLRKVLEFNSTRLKKLLCLVRHRELKYKMAKKDLLCNIDLLDLFYYLYIIRLYYDVSLSYFKTSLVIVDSFYSFLKILHSLKENVKPIYIYSKFVSRQLLNIKL